MYIARTTAQWVTESIRYAFLPGRETVLDWGERASALTQGWARAKGTRTIYEIRKNPPGAYNEYSRYIF